MKRSYLFVLSGITSVIMMNTSCREKKPERPNIIFIMADDHTSKAWGIYGGILADYVVNKNIKRLADLGVVLNNAFCTNSICVPSRASILTGKYSHINGIKTLRDSLDPDSMNVAKIFQSAGYQTAIIGKWHLHREPAGFDHYMVLPGQGRYHDPVLKTPDNWQDGNKGGKEYPGFSADVITDFSIKWLKNRDVSKPFLLFTHFKATHEPFDYPERYKNLYNGIEIPYPETLFEWGPEESGRVFAGAKLEGMGGQYERDYERDSDRFYPFCEPFKIQGLERTEARKKIYQKLVKDFLRCGASIDDNIGKLLDYLEETGELENTVVIYTSDQGYFLGEHGFYEKRIMLEESLRMPFVISYPREIKGNRRIDDLILNVDFAPLLLDYAGIDVPPDMQGRSFRENLKGNTLPDWRKSVYYRYWENLPILPAHFGIRTNRYKLIFYYGQSHESFVRDTMPNEPGWEFYDLKVDPEETRNAINDPKYRQVIDSLKVELINLRSDLGYQKEKNPVISQIIEKYWNK